LGKFEQQVLSAIETTGFFVPFDVSSGRLSISGERKYQRRYEYKMRLDLLVSKDLIKRATKENKRGFVLTSKGEEIVEGYAIGSLKIEKPWRWDGKWRVVIFDIPEKRRDARDELRLALISIGFVMIQKSAWAYPYDCFDAVDLIRRKYHLSKMVRYFAVIDLDLEFDMELREQFELL